MKLSSEKYVELYSDLAEQIMAMVRQECQNI